jgi:uncharacterized protein (DUF2141 family)
MRGRSLAIVVVVMLLVSVVGADNLPTPTSQPASQPTTQPLATLTIEVKDLRNAKGQLIFGVFKAADGFPSEEGKSVAWEVRPAKRGSGAMLFTAALPPGTYAASVLHDENKSGNMDKGLGGIPKEGYGVTNNPKPRFRAATFGEATFTLPPEGAKKTISVQYF